MHNTNEKGAQLEVRGRVRLPRVMRGKRDGKSVTFRG